LKARQNCGAPASAPPDSRASTLHPAAGVSSPGVRARRASGATLLAGGRQERRSVSSRSRSNTCHSLFSSRLSMAFFTARIRTHLKRLLFACSARLFAGYAVGGESPKCSGVSHHRAPPLRHKSRRNASYPLRCLPHIASASLRPAAYLTSPASAYVATRHRPCSALCRTKGGERRIFEGL